MGSFCIQIVDQNSCQELRHNDTQKEILDCFASLIPFTKQFSKFFSEEKELKKKEEHLLASERQKERELPFCLSQIEELCSLQIEEGEEDLIFQEYTQVSRAEEVASHIDQIFDILSQGPASVLSKLQQSKSLCRPFSSLHESFEESSSLLDNAAASIQETLHLLRNALSAFDPDPKKKELLDQKLLLIDRMKKKYGTSVKEWNEYRKTLEEKIKYFESLDDEKISLEEERKNLESHLEKLSLFLTQERKKAAQVLSSKLSKEIQSLNMLGAFLEIKVEKQSRNLQGEDLIQFWLAANQGEKMTLVKESSSGGELARLLLSLKLCLAEKNKTPTLIFDEIDAGVGGETARLIGEKLKKLSSHRQIICITHFPQVACEAHLHLKVHKISEEERTHAVVQELSSDLRETELLRMLGGKKTLSFYKKS